MKALSYAIEISFLVVLAPGARLLRFLGWRARTTTILGWWGSETVGDVGILGQLFAECRQVAPESDLSIVSFDAGITTKTLADLEAQDVKLVKVGIHSAWQVATSRCVVFGGGPLMESPSMFIWAWIARLARVSGTRVACFANGIGPVRTEGNARAITALARCATHIVLRDDASCEWLKKRDPHIRATVSFDPAFDFVRGRHTPPAMRSAQLALALRTPPSSYLGEVDSEHATEAFLELIASCLNVLARTHAVRFVGIVMHDGKRDSDDHALYSRLRDRLTHPELLSVKPGRHSIDDAIHCIAESQAALTVRFHAMIFALATGTPFVAVDYARPNGKVSAAAAMVDREHDVIEWDALRSEDLVKRLQMLLEAEPRQVPDLALASRRRLDVLRDALH